MCLVKKPKVVQPTSTADKVLPVLRNPYLDGLDPFLKARAGGVRGLTIQRGGQSPTIPRPVTPTVPTTPTTPTSPGGGGGSGGGGSPATGGGGRGTLTDDQLTTLNGLARMPGSMGAATRNLLLKAK